MSSPEKKQLLTKSLVITVAQAASKFNKGHIALKTKRAATYDAQSNIGLITQSYGSVYGSVLPYCIVNMIITVSALLLKEHYSIDLSIKSTGHKFLSTLVSFYMIGITTTTVHRYMEARTHIGAVHWAAMDLASMSCLLTMTDQSEKAKKWRSDVIYHLLVLLIGVTGATEYGSTGQNVWDLKDMPIEAKERLKAYVFRRGESVIDPEVKNKLWFEGKVMTMLDDNLRVPTFLAFDLRRQITSWRGTPIFEKDLHCNEEREMLVHVGVILNAWSGLKKLVQTPLPFPLVQNRKYILFFWVFTLPLGLMSAVEKKVPLLAVVFFLTLGFVGLEAIIMELVDPFGNDPNDFDDVGMAIAAFRNVIYTLYDVDGPEAVKRFDREFARFLADNDDKEMN